jgi:hypothetical protein
LVDGRAPKPAAVSVTAKGPAAGPAARADLSFDPIHRTLSYTIRVSGVPAAHIYGVTIDRDSAGVKGPVVLHLSGEGVVQSKGTLKLLDADERALMAGQTALVVYTSDDPAGTVKADIHLPSVGGVSPR